MHIDLHTYMQPHTQQQLQPYIPSSSSSSSSSTRDLASCRKQRSK